LIYALILLSTTFLYFAVKEYYYIPQSERIKGLVFDKFCGSRSLLYVSFSNSEYVVVATREDCLNVVVNESLDLYYSSELDKIFMSKERNPLLILVGLMVTIMSLSFLKNSS